MRFIRTDNDEHLNISYVTKLISRNHKSQTDSVKDGNGNYHDLPISASIESIADRANETIIPDHRGQYIIIMWLYKGDDELYKVEWERLPIIGWRISEDIASPITPGMVWDSYSYYTMALMECRYSLGTRWQDLSYEGSSFASLDEAKAVLLTNCAKDAKFAVERAAKRDAAADTA